MLSSSDCSSQTDPIVSDSVSTCNVGQCAPVTARCALDVGVVRQGAPGLPVSTIGCSLLASNRKRFLWVHKDIEESFDVGRVQRPYLVKLVSCAQLRLVCSQIQAHPIHNSFTRERVQ